MVKKLCVIVVVLLLMAVLLHFCSIDHLTFNHLDSRIYPENFERYIRATFPQLDTYFRQLDERLPKIYVITPTYNREVQKAELTRLLNTFTHIRNLHWILVEDSSNRTELVTKLLRNSNLLFTHLVAETPKKWKLENNEASWRKPRGVLQRNAGIKWIRDNLKLEDVSQGVVYFADDDNTYSTKLFHLFRYKNGITVWPVAFVAKLYYEGPICLNGKVQSWHTFWGKSRRFPIDMAGFSISLKYLLSKPNVYFSLQSRRGYQESDFLSKFTSNTGELNTLDRECRLILVWHTKTEKPDITNEERMRLQVGHGSDLSLEI